MATTEPTINDTLADLLRTTRRAWKKTTVIRSENTGTLQDSNARPDILIAEPIVSPVTIETEIIPAITVEQEAHSRLGCHLKNGRAVLASIAVRLPKRLRRHDGEALRSELLAANDLEFALYTGPNSSKAVRYPKSGWINGNLRDLSVLAQSASVPPEVVAQAADHLVAGVSYAAAILQELNATNPGALEKIAAELKQHPDEQTWRMAATMLTNALVFHETLANGPGDLAHVRSLGEIAVANNNYPKSKVLAEWKKILDVNYWPIFDISRRILEVIPPATSATLLSRLVKTAEELLQNRLMRSHDLTGAVFQQLIADRKYLAAYYTTPASAALLLGLAITDSSLLEDSSWGQAANVTALRVADFSCGTGTLLSTAYQRIGQLHEIFGGDSEAIHPQMMARALVGCDVLPAAAHLTASMLAGTHPSAKYSRSSILTVAYGVLGDGKVATGSLDLLNPQGKMEVWAITAKAAGGEGQSDEDPWATLPHQTFDLVVMNPPFVRATGHEADKKGVPNPMFAAFNSSDENQRLMGKALDKLAHGTSAHGNAGLASYFFVLADRKVKVGGTLALVMPLSLLSGEAWEATRRILAKKYSGIKLLSIAGAKDEDMAFSADTGMGECLVVARKLKEGGADPGEAVADSSTRATFVVLRVRPASKLSGYTIASQINSSLTSGTIRNLEDGPVGGTRLTFGDDVVGEVISSPLPVAGGWNPTRILDFALAQTAYQLGTLGRVWLPGQQQAASVDIPLTVVRQIGETGPYHSDIDGLVQSGASRGPFEHVDADDQEAATYPILWSHDAERERTMVFPGDSEGLIRLDATPEKVQRVWETRSHCHFNQNFRFTSQSTAMQFTPRPTLGGRAWISIKLSDEDREKTLVAWANTTLGLLLHWYHANKQQSGRGNIVSTALDDLPVLDVRKLDDGKIKAAVELFDELGKKVLMSADEIDQDAVRHELDRRFLGDVLGLPTHYFENNGVIDTLRKKLAREPSLTGRVPGSPKRAKKKSSAKAPSAKKTVCKNKKVKLEDLQNKELLVPPSLFDPQE